MKIEIDDRQLAFHIGQLRHAYLQLAKGGVVHQKQFADGMISPTVQWLEKLLTTTTKEGDGSR